jgi:hypothetical protein
MTPQQLQKYVENYARANEISIREAMAFLSKRHSIGLIAELLGVTSDPPRPLTKDIQASINRYFTEQGFLIATRKRGA